MTVKRLKNEICKQQKKMAELRDCVVKAENALYADGRFKDVERVAKTKIFLEKSCHELWMALQVLEC